MQITFWKGGGFAGPSYSRRLGPLEVGSMFRPQAGEVESLIGASAFFELPARLPPRAGPPVIDGLEYRLLVVDGGRTNDVRWDDGSDLSEPLERLAGVLSSLDGWEDVPWETWH